MNRFYAMGIPVAATTMAKHYASVCQIPNIKWHKLKRSSPAGYFTCEDDKNLNNDFTVTQLNRALHETKRAKVLELITCLLNCF